MHVKVCWSFAGRRALSAHPATIHQTTTREITTELVQIWARIRDFRRDGLDEGAAGEALDAALSWFAEADGAALREDGSRRWNMAARPETLGSVGPALPPDSGDPGSAAARSAAYRAGPAEIGPLVAAARAELAAGRPAAALVIGAELHRLDGDEVAADALDLLTGAYRALGRDALAEIAEVHHRHRDLRSVQVLVPA
jgi:hypothetical protein